MPKVLVAGSINMDVVATADHHPKVGQTVMGKELHYLPGGKGANQATAAAKMGVETAMIGRLGRDGFGDQMEQALAGHGISLKDVRRVQGATGTALIVVAESDNTIVVVPGANAELRPEDVDKQDIGPDDVLVCEFEIPLETVQRFFERGKAVGARTILNPAPAQNASDELLALADVLVVNETELSFFSTKKVAEDSAEDAVMAAAKDLQKRDDQVVVVTLGSRGCLTLLRDKKLVTPGHTVNAVDTTGAGDCFVGVMAAELLEGKLPKDAVRRANAAAALCVQRLGAGTSMPTRDDLDRFLAND